VESVGLKNTSPLTAESVEDMPSCVLAPPAMEDVGISGHEISRRVTQGNRQSGMDVVVVR